MNRRMRLRYPCLEIKQKGTGREMILKFNRWEGLVLRRFGFEKVWLWRMEKIFLVLVMLPYDVKKEGWCFRARIRSWIYESKWENVPPPLLTSYVASSNPYHAFTLGLTLHCRLGLGVNLGSNRTEKQRRKGKENPGLEKPKDLVALRQLLLYFFFTSCKLRLVILEYLTLELMLEWSVDLKQA